MENIKAFKLDKFPLTLTYMADLTYFEGSLLSLFKNATGDSYLYHWCDVDENYNRWIVFRLSKAQLKSYIFGELSLKDLLLNPIDGFVYIVDIDTELQYGNIYLIQTDKLPELYIPESDSFYDLEFELNKDDKLLVLDHIFSDKEFSNIVPKLLDKYKSALKDFENKLNDILFDIYEQESTIARKPG